MCGLFVCVFVCMCALVRCLYLRFCSICYICQLLPFRWNKDEYICHCYDQKLNVLFLDAVYNRSYTYSDHIGLLLGFLPISAVIKVAIKAWRGCDRMIIMSLVVRHRRPACWIFLREALPGVPVGWITSVLDNSSTERLLVGPIAAGLRGWPYADGTITYRP